MQDHFFTLSDAVAARLRGNEGFLATFRGEASQFVRFNTSSVRQPGTVEQRNFALELFDGKRHASASMTLTGAQNDDLARIDAALTSLREILAVTDEDPLFLINTTPQSSTRVLPHALPPPEAALDAILTSGAGQDLVGFYAAGPIHAGFANSFGQRNWDTVHAFSMDACFYLQADRAVKMDYAGTAWDRDAFTAKADAAKQQLAILARPARTVKPGGYRVYLSPAAMEEIMSMLCWGGFGLSDHRTATTPLIRMREDARLSPMVTISENIAGGLAAGFQGEGFVKPDCVTLIENGVYRDCLASPRSAAEFGAPQNGAEGFESPVALDMAAGSLPSADVLKSLGTGVYIGNLWYLNYSDRNACRMTGMTRFATFWVENGEIVAPINVMRFDDTIYRMLGSNLAALTAKRDVRLSTDTYEARSRRAMTLPGAIVDDFKLTL